MVARSAANKKDLADQRAVTEEEGREAAEAHSVSHYCETSAKTNEGIEGALMQPTGSWHMHRGMCACACLAHRMCMPCTAHLLLEMD